MPTACFANPPKATVVVEARRHSRWNATKREREGATQQATWNSILLLEAGDVEGGEVGEWLAAVVMPMLGFELVRPKIQEQVDMLVEVPPANDRFGAVKAGIWVAVMLIAWCLGLGEHSAFEKLSVGCPEVSVQRSVSTDSFAAFSCPRMRTPRLAFVLEVLMEHLSEW